MLRERFGRCPPVQAVHAEHRHERFSTLNEYLAQPARNWLIRLSVA